MPDRPGLATPFPIEDLPGAVWLLAGPGTEVIAANSRAAAHPAPLTDPELLAALAAVLETGRPTRVGLTGAPTRVALVGPHRDAAGAVTGCLVQVVDVDEVAARWAVAAAQNRLLPAMLPVVPGYHLAAHYVAAAQPGRAGGDFYDALATGGGRLAVLLGDVVGAGLAATAVTAQLRGAAISALLDGDDVDAVIARLDRLAAHIPGAAGSTVCIAVIDPARGELSVGSAGHPRPLLLTEHDAGELTWRIGPPLALASERPPAHTVSITAGDVFVLYSNGLLNAGALADSLGDVPRDVDRVCSHLIGSVLNGGPSLDDAALLVVRTDPARTPPLSVSVTAAPEQLATIRRALREWTARIGLDAEEVLGLQLAVGEAATNAIEHAYRDREPGPVRLTAEVRGDGDLVVEIADEGEWRTTDPGENQHRGRGMHLIRSSMDELDVRRGNAGTVVRMSRHLGRARLAEEPGPVDPPTAEEADADTVTFEVHTSHDAILVRLGGILDAVDAEEVHRRLQQLSRAGSAPLTVDLSGVRLVDSTGVRVLFELALQATAAGGKLTVLTLEGSLPHRVLSITGLDQVATLAAS
ncbi:SpoIIE family protein phosphatase [Allokutzneria sp. A3M-2-11 16]|uniref:ATP-binding protein n=1 Tax=Allokutzneria sp. A3M-2-11 16 TaxID=2962043 RepID=UPI0020B7EEB2|nr:ATP-binding protein [Allokutzneria sp. A3M-2-11 16]MCP3801439.1 SpoIIE family protein phosphatase [Allokutzneria sp. A3M-2-11 16]